MLDRRMHSTYIGNGNGGDNLASVKIPETKSISLLNTRGRLEDGQRDNKVRSKDDLLLPVDAQAVR